MLIRPLTSDDEAFLWKALYYAIHVPPGEAAPAPDTVERLDLACYVSGWMQHSDDLGFLAEEDGAPVGAAWLRRWSGGKRGYPVGELEGNSLTIW